MPTIKQTVAYSFEELSEEAKQKAIIDNYYINVEHDWWQYSYELFAQMAEMLMIQDFEISGFDIDRGRSIDMKGVLHYPDFAHLCSDKYKREGGYAAQDTLIDYAKQVKPKRLCPQAYKVLNNLDFDLYAEMIVNRYGCSSDTVIDVVNDYFRHYDSAKVESDLDKCVQAIASFLEEFKNWCFQVLKDEFSYLTSDEAISETIIANDYKFDVDGERI